MGYGLRIKGYGIRGSEFKGYGFWVERILFLLVCFLFVLNASVYSVQSDDEIIQKLTSGSEKERVLAANEVLANPTGHSITVVRVAVDVARTVGDERHVPHLIKLFEDEYPAKKVYESLGVVNSERTQNTRKFDNVTRAHICRALPSIYHRIKAKGLREKIIDSMLLGMEKNEDIFVRFLCTEGIGDTYSKRAYEPLREMSEDETEDPLIRLSASRSLTQVTNMNPDLTGGHSNYVADEIIQRAADYVIEKGMPAIKRSILHE